MATTDLVEEGDGRRGSPPATTSLDAEDVEQSVAVEIDDQ
jgi:hypothetical protein